MARIESGLKKMLKDQQVPEDLEHTWEITEVVETESGWELGRCRIVSSPEDEYIGRRSTIFLLNEAQGRFDGLTDLMKALQWEELPEDEESGEADTKVVLKGVQFPGRIQYRKGRDSIKPVIDYDWVAQLEAGDSDESSNGSGGSGRKKKSGRRGRGRGRR